jgi:two-component system OmpR family sensor kinase
MIFAYHKKVYSLKKRTIGLFLILILILFLMVFAFAYMTTKDEYEKKLYLSMEYFAALIERNLLDQEVDFHQENYVIEKTKLLVQIIPYAPQYQQLITPTHQQTANPSFIFKKSNSKDITLIYNHKFNYQLQITAQHADIKKNVFRLTLQHILLPYLLVAPVTILLLFLFLLRSLHPLTVLERQINKRSANDLTPFSLDYVPQELVTLMNALNLMFERMQLYQKQQRQFVANAAHELRTPITALNLQLEILKSALPHTDEALKSYRTAEGGLLRLQNLVNQMMSLAHQESLPQQQNHQLLNISDMLKVCIEQLYPAIELKDINLTLERLDNITIYAHPEQINSIMFNLLDNAIKYTPKYGIINISLYVEQRDILLRIEDSGSGIKPEHVSKVFQRFYRLNDHSHIIGSGLGLSIVKIVVEQLHGHIDLQPSELGGLLVLVKIPLAKP